MALVEERVEELSRRVSFVVLCVCSRILSRDRSPYSVRLSDRFKLRNMLTKREQIVREVNTT